MSVLYDDEVEGVYRGRPPKNNATATPSKERIVWAAGFIEARGAFVAAESPKLVIQVSMNKTKPVEDLTKYFGGTVYPKVPNPTRARYIQTGARLFAMLVRLWPYLSKVRKQEALKKFPALREALDKGAHA